MQLLSSWLARAPAAQPGVHFEQSSRRPHPPDPEHATPGPSCKCSASPLHIGVGGPALCNCFSSLSLGAWASYFPRGFTPAFPAQAQS